MYLYGKTILFVNYPVGCDRKIEFAGAESLSQAIYRFLVYFVRSVDTWCAPPNRCCIEDGQMEWYMRFSCPTKTDGASNCDGSPHLDAAWKPASKRWLPSAGAAGANRSTRAPGIRSRAPGAPGPPWPAARESPQHRTYHWLLTFLSAPHSESSMWRT